MNEDSESGAQQPAENRDGLAAMAILVVTVIFIVVVIYALL